LGKTSKRQRNEYIPHDWDFLCNEEEIFSMRIQTFDNLRNMGKYCANKGKRNYGEYGQIFNDALYFRVIPFGIFNPLKVFGYWKDREIPSELASLYVQIRLFLEIAASQGNQMNE
jgi:hypothetical protein